ncbi:MAG: hypothetical protein F4155_13985 [Acidimicrobiales bacterium]|nr:hypothetical protein [Acidimicrobiales bacterium]MYH75892.1 hypothetical protein [Acidimicrobiales bacterium]MYK71466.1 hypothetical protein [Acidimicrobiales bacterium]
MSFVDAAAEADLTEFDGVPGEGQRLVLREWTPCPIDLTLDQAEALRDVGSGGQSWLRVERARSRAKGDNQSYKVTPRHFVGSFSAAGFTVIVRPKIKPENLFLLLEVGLSPEAWQAEAIDYAESNELLPTLVSFFARTAETTLARGLFHHYRHEEDDLLALRGRSDFVRQFRRGGVLVPMACSWDDFTADVDENRCLTAAIRLALRVPDVPPDDRRRLRRLLAALDGVAEPTALVALGCIDRLDRSGYTRLNEHYRPALRLARLILANYTLQDQHGDTAASAFMVDMNQLFEDFVTARLQRALRSRLHVRAQTQPYLDDKRRVRIQPDLAFEHQGRNVGCADLKYKLADSDTDAVGPLARHGDYYQLLAYTTALNLSEGTLIYCADVNRNEIGDPDGSAGLDRMTDAAGEDSGHDGAVATLAKSTITVQHVGTKLHAVAIDLSGTPSDIETQITALADHLKRSTEGTAASEPASG